MYKKNIEVLISDYSGFVKSFLKMSVFIRFLLKTICDNIVAVERKKSIGHGVRVADKIQGITLSYYFCCFL